jgi:hypothetical protein
MHKLILASALFLAAIIPAKAEQPSFTSEELKAAVWLLKNWEAVQADMDKADRAAGRKLGVHEHISRWFPYDRSSEHFDRLRMQRNGEVIR